MEVAEHLEVLVLVLIPVFFNLILPFKKKIIAFFLKIFTWFLAMLFSFLFLVLHKLTFWIFFFFLFYVVEEDMASSFSTLFIFGPFAAPGSFATNKKLSASSQQLPQFSSFTSISSWSLAGGRQELHLQRKCNSKISAMAKELYFNKDGSAIKKLQVSSLFTFCIVISTIYLYSLFANIFFPCHFRPESISLPTLLGLLLAPRGGMLSWRASMDPQKLSMTWLRVRKRYFYIMNNMNCLLL